jgi:purine-binding chemotaxis protein CheW
MRPASEVEAVWRDRAQRLSQRPASAEAGQNFWPVLVLAIAKERYAISLSDVAEVLAPVRPTPVPGAATVFAGVINVHGEIRAVLDLSRLLGLPQPARSGDPVRVILLRRQGLELGLRIDSVEQIRWVGPGEMQPAGSGAVDSSPYIQGSTPDLLMLLSTEALFAHLHTGVTN